MARRSERSGLIASKRSRRVLRLLNLIVLLLSSSGIGLAAPQHRGSDGPFETGNTSWEGLSAFVELARARLGHDRVVLTATLDYSELESADGVLVLHPEVDLEFSKVSEFLQVGGRLGVIDDYGTSAPLLQRFGIRRIEAPQNPSRSLRKNARLALATPVLQQVPGSGPGRHPMVRYVDEVVTNHPTALEHPDLTPVLELERDAGPPATFAVTGIIANRGRLFAMGDPSVFINLMLRYPGNRALAEGLIDYLVESDDGEYRRGKLFILANHFRQVGRFGGETTALDDAEERLEALRESLEEWHRDGIPPELAIALGILVATAVGGWLLLSRSRVYEPALPGFAARVPLVAQGGLSGRAHVLAAPTTNPVLPLLELKTGILEALAAHLGVAPGAAPEQLLSDAKQRSVLDADQATRLGALIRDLRRWEETLTSGGRRKPSLAEVQRLHRDAMSLFEILSGKSTHSKRHEPASETGRNGQVLPVPTRSEQDERGTND